MTISDMTVFRYFLVIYSLPQSFRCVF